MKNKNFSPREYVVKNIKHCKWGILSKVYYNFMKLAAISMSGVLSYSLHIAKMPEFTAFSSVSTMLFMGLYSQLAMMKNVDELRYKRLEVQFVKNELRNHDDIRDYINEFALRCQTKEKFKTVCGVFDMILAFGLYMYSFVFGTSLSENTINMQIVVSILGGFLTVRFIDNFEKAICYGSLNDDLKLDLDIDEAIQKRIRGK